ncbi:MAG TPA: hypothetical protein VH165_26340, partial [Kofleriaceae bacterium]|nr:hypothetical protein [Kofleriaceae bacterium]
MIDAPAIVQEAPMFTALLGWLTFYDALIYPLPGALTAKALRENTCSSPKAKDRTSSSSARTSSSSEQRFATAMHAGCITAARSRARQGGYPAGEKTTCA